MVRSKRIGVLFICTGKYSQFFREFYFSSEKFFLPDFTKTYYVWTDDSSLERIGERIVLLYKKCEGFPLDSLFRFDMFVQASELLKREDYLFFFNSNAEFRSTVGPEFLPDDSGLIAALWPGKRLRQNPMFYPYERNKGSLAYIPPFDPPYHYYMGGLNGGVTDEYLNMSRQLSNNIRRDYEKGIVATVHDESHINAFFHKHKCKIISQEYCWPEEWESSFSPKIVFRDKVKLDPYFNKGRDRSIGGKIKKGLVIVKRAISWFI